MGLTFINAASKQKCLGAYLGEIPSSKWKLNVKVLRKVRNDAVLHVRLTTQPIPTDPHSSKDLEDPHPFSMLGEEWIDEDTIHLDKIRAGILEHYCANNPIVQSILKIIPHPKKLHMYSGSTDWRWYRMLLIRVLDCLWD